MELLTFSVTISNVKQTRLIFIGQFCFLLQIKTSLVGTNALKIVTKNDSLNVIKTVKQENVNSSSNICEKRTSTVWHWMFFHSRQKCSYLVVVFSLVVCSLRSFLIVSSSENVTWFYDKIKGKIVGFWGNLQWNPVKHQ